MANTQGRVALGEIQVHTTEGNPVSLGDLVSGPAILVIPRHYGCKDCHEYLSQLSGRLEEVSEAGGAALAVSVGADHQARWLMAGRVRFSLLVDRQRRVHAALDLPRKRWVALVPGAWADYVRALIRGNREGTVIDPNQLPGLALLDASATAVWVHRGRTLDDYPKLDEVLARLRRLTRDDQGVTSTPPHADA